LIANDVADHQLRILEKKAFGVMTTPGDVEVILALHDFKSLH
jgi:hypothetical protein